MSDLSLNHSRTTAFQRGESEPTAGQFVHSKRCSVASRDSCSGRVIIMREKCQFVTPHVGDHASPTNQKYCVTCVFAPSLTQQLKILIALSQKTVEDRHACLAACLASSIYRHTSFSNFPVQHFLGEMRFQFSHRKCAGRGAKTQNQRNMILSCILPFLSTDIR